MMFKQYYEKKKKTASEMSAILTHISDQSRRSGHLPQIGKMPIVPIYKNGDKAKAENYHSVSITSTACKILIHVSVACLMQP